MELNTKLLDELTAKAQASPRLRMNLDLRTSADDKSQRMLNALEPGTVVPIHRHTKSTEVFVVLRGSGIHHVYDDSGKEIEAIPVAAGGPCPGYSVPVGQWHRLESLESGTIIFEAKDGAYEPLAPEDVKNI